MEGTESCSRCAVQDLDRDSVYSVTLCNTTTVGAVGLSTF